jgi:hypothetical protein
MQAADSPNSKFANQWLAKLFRERQKMKNEQSPVMGDERHLLASLHAHNSRSPDNTAEILVLLAQLAKLYRSEARKSAAQAGEGHFVAQRYYYQAVDCWRAMLNIHTDASDKGPMAKCHTKLAGLLRHLGKWVESFEHLCEAHRLWEEVYGPKDPRTVVSLQRRLLYYQPDSPAYEQVAMRLWQFSPFRHAHDEIELAIRWWKDRLSESLVRYQAGDGILMDTTWMNVTRCLALRAVDDVLIAFEEALRLELPARWHPSSSSRRKQIVPVITVKLHHHPPILDEVLRCALWVSGIKLSPSASPLFGNDNPWSMRIQPGLVGVKMNDAWEVLYRHKSSH